MNAIMQPGDLPGAAADEPLPLPLDGERFVPGEMHGNIELEHCHRYVFASQFVAGKAVLDIACGEGYGSALLARSARGVTGVDISELAVEHAKRRYRADNLEFVTGSCTAIPLADGAVDVVVSFETIEHHAEHEAMLREIARVLRPDGLLVISSPDKLEYSDKRSFRNPFHVKEIYKQEFQQLLSNHFRQVRLFGQRVVLGSVILGESGSERIRLQRLEQPDLCPTDLEPMYWVALASKDTLPPVDDSIYNQQLAIVDETAGRRRDAVLTRVIRALAVPDSERLQSCLRSEWYLERNADLAAAKIDPYEHWIATGAQEGRLPASDCVALAEELLRESVQVAQHECLRQEDQSPADGGELKSRQSAGRTRRLRRQVHDLGEQLQQSQIRADAILEQNRREAQERLLRQQEILEAQRVQLAEAADRRLTALAAEGSERERLLHHELQSLRECLGEAQRGALDALERADRDAAAQLAAHLAGAAQRDQTFAAQLLQQQEKFDRERTAFAESMQQRLSAQAAQHTEREWQLQQEVHNLRERMEAQFRQSLEREQAFAARLLQEHVRLDELVVEERARLHAHYSTVLLGVKRNLDELQASMSWRVAAPIRAIAAAFGARVSLPRIEALESLIQLPRYRRD